MKVLIRGAIKTRYTVLKREVLLSRGNYFEEEKNIGSIDVLVAAATQAGLDGSKVSLLILFSFCQVRDYLQSEEDKDAIKQEARTVSGEYGVTGVPFFVFNDKYAVSGAQPVDTFLRTLEISWEEFEKENGSLITMEGETCSVDGTCN